MKSRHHPIHLAARAESGNEAATLLCAIRRLRSASGLGVLWFAFVFALSSSSLEAETADTIMQSHKRATSGECASWDVSKSWGLKQSDGNLVQMELRQGYELNLIAQTAPPSSISGTASYRDKNGPRVGNVKGTVLGNKFNVHVIWPNGSGHWIGTILPSGIIQGSCSDDNVRSYKATFVSDRPMRCVPPPPPPPPQPPTSQPLTDTIKRGSFVILQSKPPPNSHSYHHYHDLVIGQKYEVMWRAGGLVDIRGPSGRPHHLDVSSVKLVQ